MKKQKLQTCVPIVIDDDNNDVSSQITPLAFFTPKKQSSSETVNDLTGELPETITTEQIFESHESMTEKTIETKKLVKLLTSTPEITIAVDDDEKGRRRRRGGRKEQAAKEKEINDLPKQSHSHPVNFFIGLTERHRLINEWAKKHCVGNYFVPVSQCYNAGRDIICRGLDLEHVQNLIRSMVDRGLYFSLLQGVIRVPKGTQIPDKDSDDIIEFIKNKKIEMIAGNHRLKALKILLEKSEEKSRKDYEYVQINLHICENNDENRLKLYELGSIENENQKVQKKFDFREEIVIARQIWSDNVTKYGQLADQANKALDMNEVIKKCRKDIKARFSLNRSEPVYVYEKIACLPSDYFRKVLQMLTPTVSAPHCASGYYTFQLCANVPDNKFKKLINEWKGTDPKENKQFRISCSNITNTISIEKKIMELIFKKGDQKLLQSNHITPHSSFTKYKLVYPDTCSQSFTSMLLQKRAEKSKRVDKDKYVTDMIVANIRKEDTWRDKISASRVFDKIIHII